MVDPLPRTSSRTRTVPRRLAGTTAEDDDNDKHNKNKNQSNPAAARATSAVHRSLVSPTPCTAGATAMPASSLLPSSSSSLRNEPTPSSATVTPSQLLVASSSSSKLVVEKQGGRNNTRNSNSNSNGNEDDDDSDNDSDTIMSVVDLTALSSDEEAGDLFQRKLPPHWKCPRCTLLNDNAASMCTACEYNPIEDEDDETTWHCSDCTLVNPNTDTQCNACGAAAPGSSSTSSSSSSSSDVDPAIGTEHTAETDDEETRMLAELPNGRITTKREPNLKRKTAEISVTGAGIGRGLRTKKTKRIKREADSNRKKGNRDTSRNRDDVHDDDDDDVVVSAVVEARRNKKKRRDGTRTCTRTGNNMDGLGRVAAVLATNDTDADVDDDVVLEGVVNETKYVVLSLLRTHWILLFRNTFLFKNEEETCAYLLFLFFLFCFTMKDYHIAVRTVLSVLL